MPRYHFNLYDGVVEPDKVGHSLADIQSAKKQAARYLGQLLIDRPTELQGHDDMRLEVTDGRGLILFQMIAHLTDAPVLSG